MRWLIEAHVFDNWECKSMIFLTNFHTLVISEGFLLIHSSPCSDRRCYLENHRQRSCIEYGPIDGFQRCLCYICSAWSAIGNAKLILRLKFYGHIVGFLNVIFPMINKKNTAIFECFIRTYDWDAPSMRIWAFFKLDSKRCLSTVSTLRFFGNHLHFGKLRKFWVPFAKTFNAI